MQNQDADAHNRFFSYELLEGRLIGSEHPAACGTPSVRIAQRVNETTALLTLTRQFTRYEVPGLVQHHVPMGDVPERWQVAEAVGLVESHLNRGERAWVHCQKGLDRTGCVIGAVLVRTGLHPDKAIAMLLEHFPSQRRTPHMLALWRPFADLIRTFHCDGKINES